MAALSLQAMPARSAFSTRPPPEELAAGADAAVVARVVECRSAWDPTHRNIFTAIRLAVSEQWSGRALGPELRLTQLGGTVDGLSLAVPGLPRFTPGSEVVLFLHRTSYGNLHVVGLADGVFRVLRVPGAAEASVERDGASWDMGGAPARGRPERMSLDELRAAARAHARR